MEKVMQFLTDTHLFGLVIGLATFLVIGLFHPLVIKAEYYMGTRSWILFLLVGIAAGALSVITASLILSVILGVVGFSSLWSILEVFQQEERVKKGWFPANPNRKKKD